MSDMNFFSSYTKKSEKKNTERSTVIINGIVILILIGILSYGTFNLLTIRNLSKDILALKTELEVSRKDPKISEIIAKEKDVSALKEDLSKLYALDKYVNDIDTVNEFVLEDIRVNTPPELFLASMTMSQEIIKIEGKSKDKESIAQFEHNLREIEGLDKVFIPRVTAENGHYSFYLDINLKEEMTDGAEAGKK